MVAISLYRGNLHRVPDVPRRWLMPTRQISLKDFKFLLRRRERVLSRLLPISTTTATSSNPNPNSDHHHPEEEEDFVGDNGCSKQNLLQIDGVPHPQLQPGDIRTTETTSSEDGPSGVGDAKDHNRLDGDPTLEQRRGSGDSDSSPVAKSPVPEGVKEGSGIGGSLEALEEPLEDEKLVVSAPLPAEEISKLVAADTEREKKKKELEQKLQVLNEKKHNLVQMLKQILNAEEEMKRRNSMQPSFVRPPAPLQLEATNDLGSNPRHSVTRTGPEANSCGDLEGESEDVPNHNTQPRHFHQMRITSPSAPSPLRKPALTMLHHTSVQNTTRASLGGGGFTQMTSSIMGVAAASPSPSRFAPTGHMPSLSVSGTHFSASSPSPAGSGGTSVFRDSRLTSPSWN